MVDGLVLQHDKLIGLEERAAQALIHARKVEEQLLDAVVGECQQGLAILELLVLLSNN